MIRALIDRLLLAIGAIFLLLNLLCGLFAAGLVADNLTAAPDDPGMGFLLWFIAGVSTIYAFVVREYD